MASVADHNELQLACEVAALREALRAWSTRPVEHPPQAGGFGELIGKTDRMRLVVSMKGGMV